MLVFYCFNAFSQRGANGSQFFYLVCLPASPFPISINHAPSISTIPVRLESGLYPIKTNGRCMHTSSALQRRNGFNEGRWALPASGELPALPRPCRGAQVSGCSGQRRRRALSAVLQPKRQGHCCYHHQSRGSLQAARQK